MTQEVRITRRATFAAAHILCRDDWSDERNRDVFGACTTDHGHNYVIEVTVAGPLDPLTGSILWHNPLRGYGVGAAHLCSARGQSSQTSVVQAQHADDYTRRRFNDIAALGRRVINRAAAGAILKWFGHRPFPPETTCYLEMHHRCHIAR